MKRILIFLLVIASYCVIAQSNKVDTISIQYEKFQSVQQLNNQIYTLSKKNGQFYLVKESAFMYNVDTPDLFCFFNYPSLYYCKLYYKDKIIEEGIWDLYYFEGYYRSYFKNGKVKSEGNFNSSVEVGKWIYYKKDGRIFRVILYPNDVDALSERKKGKISIRKTIKLYSYPTPQDSINFVKSVKGIWLWRYR